MKFLIGDIGNTSTKICVLNNKFKILRSYNFETNKMYSGNFLKMITRRKIYKDLSPIFLFSSVVPKVFRNIEKQTTFRFLRKKYFHSLRSTYLMRKKVIIK